MKRTSTEAHVYMRRHQGAKVKHFDVSNVIYHKFSHGAVSYALNEENVKRHVRIFNHVHPWLSMYIQGLLRNDLIVIVAKQIVPVTIQLYISPENDVLLMQIDNPFARNGC